MKNFEVLSYGAAWQTHELYNFTLAEWAQRVQLKDFIAIMRLFNR